MRLKLSDGIDQFLNATAERHNGLDAHTFRLFMEKNVSVASGARAFGVTRIIYYKYQHQYYIEKQKLDNEASLRHNNAQEASNDKKGTD